MISLYWLFLICPLAYLLGNFNPSIVIVKRVFKDDITKKASGNPGTMNVMRNYGLFWGLTILLLDALKGAAPALIAMALWGHENPIGRIGMLAAGASAVIGHLFPVVYKFKGGKGVATTFGIFFVISPIISSIMLGIAAFVLVFLESGVLASFTFITTLIVSEGLDPINKSNIAVCLLLFFIFFMIWFAHRKNIARLLIGKENKVTIFKSLRNRKQRKMEEQLIKELRQSEEGN